MKIAYEDRQPPFNARDRLTIARCDAICAQMAADGYSLTLRQLYYQLVQDNFFPNREQSYNYLKRVMSEARRAGLIDWDHIVDRTRRWEYRPHWGDPTVAIKDAAKEFVTEVVPQYRSLKWATQPYYVEVWVEKEALVDVIARPARRHDLSYFAARGYASESSQHEAAMRFVTAIEAGKQAVILHLGDHDPSGIDMSRDILERINLFVEYWTSESVQVNRLALNMDQIIQYDPPPNPAKMTDSRFSGYRDRYGTSSWELDALTPPVIDALITAAVDDLRDDEAWKAAIQHEQDALRLLAAVDVYWDEVTDLLKGRHEATPWTPPPDMRG